VVLDAEGVAVENVVLGLAALACPVGMGVMMWFMAKGARSGRSSDSEAPGSLDDLRAEHRRLGAEIDRLEDDSTRSSFAGTPR
jgi:hypothetical protein